MRRPKGRPPAWQRARPVLPTPQPTPGPWRLEGDTNPKCGQARIVGADGTLVAVCHGPGEWVTPTGEQLANADRILRAVQWLDFLDRLPPP